ncbi:hypothetical protein L227DRAFT_556112 [Lentinus tigrinus ALCF2SS1-6]|uniref:Uncharacterized protein n=1 Tax=Lentinus tigrinus ALCF2SS1-6 TaxID=1328759 RepID=A0A5C2RW81_9APHY|nr:hypothetical protein L227DRAFT_556112 [Lentinus tigrinus ALCF2SS1-6]
MLSKRAVENTIIVVALIVLVMNAAFKLAAQTIVRRAEEQGRAPQHPLWHVERKEVVLELDSWTRYTLHSDAQWASLFPDGGIIHLGPTRAPYTVSMMHQLRCLDFVREQLAKPVPDRDPEPTRHCLNYLRQMVTCRGDLHFDLYQYAHKVNAVHPHAVRRCKDWRVVYEKVWENQREHHTWVGEGGI